MTKQKSKKYLVLLRWLFDTPYQVSAIILLKAFQTVKSHTLYCVYSALMEIELDFKTFYCSLDDFRVIKMSQWNENKLSEMRHCR